MRSNTKPCIAQQKENAFSFEDALYQGKINNH